MQHLMLALAVFFAIAAIVAPTAECFLFDRSVIVQTPLLGTLRIFAVVNTSARIAVSISNPTSQIFFTKELYQTVTMPLSYAENSTYSFISRRLPPAVQQVRSDISYDIFLSPDNNALWMLASDTFDHVTVLAVSISDCAVLQSTIIPIDHGFANSWALATWTNGSAFPVVDTHDFGEGVALLWQLPDGTQASFDYACQPCWFASKAGSEAWPVVYTVCFNLSGSDTLFTAARLNLTDASLVVSPSAASLPLGDPFEFTGCALHLDAANSSSPIAFLGVFKSGALALLLLDPVTFNITPMLISGIIDGSVLHCGPTVVPTQFLVWEADDQYQRDRDTNVYLLDVANGSLTLLNVPVPPAFSLISARITGAGDAVITVCDVVASLGDHARECRYMYYDAFNASTSLGLPPDATVVIGTIEPTFGVSKEANGSVVMTVKNLAPSQPEWGFLVSSVTDLAHPQVYVGMPAGVSPLSLAGALAYDGQRIFVVPTEWPASLYVFQLQSCPSVSDAVRLYDAQELFNSSYLVKLTAYNGTLTAVIPSTHKNCTVFRVSVPDMELLSIAHFDVGIQQFIPFSTTVAAMADEGVALLNANLTSLIQYWPIAAPGSDPPYYTVASAASGDSFYALYYQEDFICTRLSLTNTSSSFSVVHWHNFTDLSPSTNSVYVATVFSDYVYVVAIHSPVFVIRFDLNCTPQEAYNTRLDSDLFSTFQYGDQLFVSQAPIITPIFLDCGSGVYRNISSGACEACPNGSVNALPDTQACVACMARTEPNAQRTSCVCAAGFYSANDNEDCDECPVGGVCAGDNQLSPDAGYWRADPTSDTFYTCPLPDACNGSDVCASGYGGPLCAVCSSHYGLVINECRRCTSSGAAIGFWIASGLVYVCLFLALVYNGGSSFSVLKSLISFAQIVTFPTNGPAPHLLRTRLTVLTHFLSLANLQLLSLVSPDCLLGHHLPYPISAIMSASIPALLVAVVVLLFRVPWSQLRAWIVSKSHKRSPDPFYEETPGLIDHIDRYARTGAPVRLAIFIVLLTSPSSTQQLASCFTCSSVAGVLYMARDFAVKCYEGLWSLLAAPVSVLFVLYAVGVPLGFFVLLRKYRESLDLRVLHGSYKPQYYWWDCVEQLRKISLLLCNAVLQPSEPSFFGPTSLAISMLALCVHCLVRPHKALRDFCFQAAQLTGLCLFFLWFITSGNDDSESTDVFAWIYWVYAVCYALASISVMLFPLAMRLWAAVCVCGRKCFGPGTRLAHQHDHSELDRLFSKPRTSD